MASSVSDATRSGGSDVVAGAGSRPRIGITTYLEPARWGVWDQPATLLPHAYVEVLHRAGGVPVLLPPLPDGAADVLIGVDGLLLAGGADVDPERYGAPPQEGTDRPRRDRDGWEFGLLAVALAQRMPVLGVCRGAQVLNVAAGGTLHQHLPDVLGHDGHRPALGRFGRVQVRIDPCQHPGRGARPRGGRAVLAPPGDRPPGYGVAGHRPGRGRDDRGRGGRGPRIRGRRAVAS